MTEMLLQVALVLLIVVLIIRLQDWAYRQGYQDGAASRPPRVKIGFKNNQKKDNDTTTIH